ncbi:hypothetical protein, partial [uncultured Duncaniella sp.]|uniref:hypothetical protein n=1 Tax=uncultured Duncaniella sp. TaxID=2768039 RepID=UPI0025A9B350
MSVQAAPCHGKYVDNHGSFPGFPPVSLPLHGPEPDSRLLQLLDAEPAEPLPGYPRVPAEGIHAAPVCRVNPETLHQGQNLAAPLAKLLPRPAHALHAGAELAIFLHGHLPQAPGP